MSKLRKSEEEFVSYALTILKDADMAMEGSQLLNRFFATHKSTYVMPSRRQLLTVLRKQGAIYARMIYTGSKTTTFYSLNPILSPAHKNDGSNCSARRYKRAIN